MGEEPGPRGEPGCPLYPLPAGCAGARLRELFGLSLTEYLRAFDRTNLGWRNGSDAAELRAAAWALRPLLAGRSALLLGRRVLRAFELGEPEPLSWLWLDCGRGPAWDVRRKRLARVAYLPHPSGRNRWYNEEENVRRAREFLRELR